MKSISGIEKAKKVAGVQQISIVHGVGEEVTEIDSSASRIGFVIAQDENSEKAIRDCYDALDKITILIRQV